MKKSLLILNAAVVSATLGLCLGFYGGMRNVKVLTAQADSAARTDYAELVNACYESSESDSARELYGCIAAANPPEDEPGTGDFEHLVNYCHDKYGTTAAFFTCAHSAIVASEQAN